MFFGECIGSWKIRFERVLVYAGVAYALGFLTVMFHTAQYGIQVIEGIKPLNFWIGTPPTLVLLVSLAILTRVTQISAKSVRQARKEDSDVTQSSLREAGGAFTEISGFCF
jgi:hypothetical protein